MFFILSLVGLALACLGLSTFAKSRQPACDDAQFIGFQRSYLTVYLLAVGADWLQGPHVYALYQHYGMSKHQIEQLFIAGFGSSLVFGTFIGSLADKIGRKLNCFLYAVFYGIGCVTKHFGNFWILMSGRLLSGIATSILFSAFESWLVYEHNKRGFSDSQLSIIFSQATFGNSVIAICAGVVAQGVADTFGYVAPFDVSLGVLCVMAVVIFKTWPENFGNKSVAFKSSLQSGYKAIREDSNVLYLGLIQSLFEGTMYTFVIEWTPTLAAASEASIPHGLIFAAFMIAVMIGSYVFSILTSYAEPESFMRFVLVTAALCFVAPILLPGNLTAVFFSFIVFEICVGIFWPAVGYLRGRYIKEETRSTTMNFFRVPLNIIVIAILCNDFSTIIIFKCCVVFLALASFMQYCLYENTVGKTAPQVIEKAPLPLN
uniref:Molybdate transporter 2 homolog n=1 Tax=Panagrellus redivivus TaxID=6233 RepID=A0A7E4W915_PANRE